MFVWDLDDDGQFDPLDDPDESLSFSFSSIFELVSSAPNLELILKANFDFAWHFYSFEICGSSKASVSSSISILIAVFWANKP